MPGVNNSDNSNISIYSSVIFFFLLIIGFTICICWYTLKKKK